MKGNSDLFGERLAKAHKVSHPVVLTQGVYVYSKSGKIAVIRKLTRNRWQVVDVDMTLHEFTSYRECKGYLGCT